MNFAASIANRAILIDSGRVIADDKAIKIMTDQKLMTEHGLEVATAVKSDSSFS